MKVMMQKQLRGIREGYSPTTPFACLGAPFLNVF